MKLHHIRDVLAVAERGSLRAAAREIGIAQPAITRSLQELERELGVPLFERDSRGVSLTAMGEAFIPRARAIRAELIRAKDEIDQLRGEKHGHVTVALSMVPHIAMLPFVLRPFRLRYPDVRLDIIDAVFTTVESRMNDSTIDCYVGPLPELLSDRFVVEKLFDNTRVVVGRKGHPLSRARSLRELVNAEWISNSITAKAEHEFSPIFTRYRLPPPKLVMQSHSSITVISAIMSSDLLTMLPAQWDEYSPLRKDIQKIDVVEQLPASPICLIQRTGLPLTPAAEYFCDLMRRSGEHLGRKLERPVQGVTLRRTVSKKAN